MNIYKREYYLQKVRPFIDKQLIKVFTGQRRVGKSYLMMQIRDEIQERKPDANIIYINLEKLEFSKIKNFTQLAEYIATHTKEVNNYLFIDEIQEIEGFEKVLRSLVSEANFDIYCTGSNARMLSGEFATYLSGRQIEIRVHSLSYPEFLEFHQLTNNINTLNLYLQFGGMPYLINLHDDNEIKSEYLNNILNTILFRDIVSRFDIRDISFLENLIRYIADNVGSLLSATNISKFLKSQNIQKSTQSIINYIEYIENSFIINRVRRLNLQGKKIIESGEKFYYEDLGIRNQIVGFNISEIQIIIENAVYNHLLFKGYKVFVGKIQNTEIDFVAEKNGETVYLQVAYLLKDESTINREFGNLLKINDNFPKYVISYDSLTASNTYKGIKHLILEDFLLNF
jgi:predicted AAA+ superfamily ATPase